MAVAELLVLGTGAAVPRGQWIDSDDTKHVFVLPTDIKTYTTDTWQEVKAT